MPHIRVAQRRLALRHCAGPFPSATVAAQIFNEGEGIAIGETAIPLHPPLPSLGCSIRAGEGVSAK